jgi:hypothetical protein
VSHAIFLLGLRSRQLVIALELELLPLHNREDGIGAPFTLVGFTALGLAASAPLIGEKQLAALVVECRRVPVGKVDIRRGSKALGMYRIADIKQEAIALAGTPA